ncbi:MAG: AAA family ATPase [Pseudomonadota bacterium]
MTAAAVHMVCGAVGAGKTTYALGLCDETGGVHLSIDDWMTRLFGKDAPRPPQWDWVAERLRRCEDQMALVAFQCVRRGVSAILDQSFLRQEDRSRLAAAAAGLPIRLHVLDVPAEERWRRVVGRNAQKGQTFSLEVSRAMFDFVERLWQPPTAAEMVALRGVRVSAQAPY